MARAFRIGVAAAIIAGCLWGMSRQIALFRLGRSIRQLERASGAFFTNADRAGARALARSEAARVEGLIERFRWHSELHMIAAANYRTLGAPEKAIHHYEEALTTDYRPEILLNLATVQLESGNSAEATARFLEVLDYDPWYYQFFPHGALQSWAVP